MSRPTELAADTLVAAAGSAVHLVKPAGASGGGGATAGGARVLVGHGAGVAAARWNRNNKVVASGAADGRVQLLYSSGQVMAVLPAAGALPGAVASLSWSMGSKRLAAGTDAGSVFLFEMGGAATKARPLPAAQGAGAAAAAARCRRSPRKPRPLPCCRRPLPRRWRRWSWGGTWAA